MKITQYFKVLLAFLFVFNANAQEKKYQIHTVAFYNFENLFDTINGPNYDEEWLPDGPRNWNSKKYRKKLENLSRVISEIGTSENPNTPTFVGACEIENRLVLEDLVKMPKIINSDYGIVHYESPDKRGIDVALLYKKKHFTVTSTSNIPLYIYKNQAASVKKKEVTEETDDESNALNSDDRIYTRDQLLVTGYLDGEEINIIVNHWPSRSGGEKKSSPYREAAGALNRKIIDSLIAINPKAKVITMGDLNDGSYNKSVKKKIGAKLKKEELKEPKDVYNPFERMAKEGHATLFYRDSGDIFDQIMLTEQFINGESKSYKYWKAGIYNKPYLIQTTGQYKGYPLRNSNSEPGFSDHFPVYVYLIKQIN